MRITSWSVIFLAIILNFTGCASSKVVSAPHNSNLLNSEGMDLVFFGALSLPLEIGSKGLWVEKGPILIAPNKNTIAYRVIDKKELEFIGTDKTPYEFFNSAFNKPTDPIEQLFIVGLGDADKLSHHTNNNIEIYVMERNSSLKLYILSSALDFVVEVTSNTNSIEFVKNIISKTHLKLAE